MPTSPGSPTESRSLSVAERTWEKRRPPRARTGAALGPLARVRQAELASSSSAAPAQQHRTVPVPNLPLTCGHGRRRRGFITGPGAPFPARAAEGLGSARRGRGCARRAPRGCLSSGAARRRRASRVPRHGSLARSLPPHRQSRGSGRASLQGLAPG